MHSVINQCCPNRYLAICSPTVVTPTQVVSLVLFTVQFFFHTLGLHTAPVARFLFHPHSVFIANLQCTFQELQHFFFFSKFFHIGFISRPVTKKQNLVGHGHGQGSAPFLFVLPNENLYLLLNSHSDFHIPCFSLEFPCHCLGCPFFRTFAKHVSF